MESEKQRSDMTYSRSSSQEMASQGSNANNRLHRPCQLLTTQTGAEALRGV